MPEYSATRSFDLTIDVIDEYKGHRPDFAWPRLDRLSGSGALTAQLTGSPIPVGGTGATIGEGAYFELTA